MWWAVPTLQLFRRAFEMVGDAHPTAFEGMVGDAHPTASITLLFGRMNCTLHFGRDQSLDLELANGGWLAECGKPQQPPLEDVQGAVVAALAEPLSYPPLEKSFVPGDRIALALEPGVPQAADLVAAIVDYLVRVGVEPGAVTVLRTVFDAQHGAADPRHLLPPEVQKQVQLVTHDPAVDDKVGYLGASDDGKPILLNRAILEADVVLPIGAIGNRRSPEYHGVHGAVYPTYSDKQTLARFRSLGVLNPRSKQKKHFVKTCNDVGWRLGVNFTIQVVPGEGDDVLHVIAGEVSEVRRRGRELYREAWTCAMPHRASLVIAAVTGGPEQQTWHNVGQALAAATSLAEEGGAVAVCCELEEPPGPAVRALIEGESRQVALRQIEKQRPEDALVAAQIADAVDRANVYLLSRLDEDLVEALEMAALADPEELARLVERYPSCIVLANAPHAVVRAEED